MTFLELQNVVLSDRFPESKRADSKTWLNYRYGRLWASESWSFKRTSTDVTVSANNSSVTIPLQRIEDMRDITSDQGSSYGTMTPLRPEDFYGAYSSATGRPYEYTVIGNTIYLTRPVQNTRTYRVMGEKTFTVMSADADVPLIPTEFHPVLAHGAISDMLRLENDPSWQGAEQDWTAGVTDMKSAYLASVRGFSDSYPSWP